jgi:hypothetical protein
MMVGLHARIANEGKGWLPDECAWEGSPRGSPRAPLAAPSLPLQYGVAPFAPPFDRSENQWRAEGSQPTPQIPTNQDGGNYFARHLASVIYFAPVSGFMRLMIDWAGVCQQYASLRYIIAYAVYLSRGKTTLDREVASNIFQPHAECSTFLV